MTLWQRCPYFHLLHFIIHDARHFISTPRKHFQELPRLKPLHHFEWQQLLDLPEMGSTTTPRRNTGAEKGRDSHVWPPATSPLGLDPWLCSSLGLVTRSVICSEHESLSILFTILPHTKGRNRKPRWQKTPYILKLWLWEKDHRYFSMCWIQYAFMSALLSEQV